MLKNGAIVGVSDHMGWAILVTVAADGTLLDRRRVPLVDADLPCMPYHHDAQGLPLQQALDLVERVRVSSDRNAHAALDTLAAEVSSPIRGIAIRACPPLPPTVAERLQNYRAQNVADTVMYRQSIAAAAQSRGWPVHWYETKKVFAAAGKALQVADLDEYFKQLRRSIGPPWDVDHRLAMSAAIAFSD